jgi:hypothetical protein
MSHCYSVVMIFVMLKWVKCVAKSNYKELEEKKTFKLNLLIVSLQYLLLAEFEQCLMMTSRLK